MKVVIDYVLSGGELPAMVLTTQRQGWYPRWATRIPLSKTRLMTAC